MSNRVLAHLLLLGGVVGVVFLAGSVPATAAPLQPTIVVSPTTGKPGDAVTISGTGFPPGEIVALYIDFPEPYIDGLTLKPSSHPFPPPGPVADSQGNIDTVIKWPGKNYDPKHKIDPSKPGTHLVCGDTAFPGSTEPIPVRSCAPFLALAGPSPTPSPSQGVQGASAPELVVAVLVVLVVIGGTAWLIRSRG